MVSSNVPFEAKGRELMTEATLAASPFEKPRLSFILVTWFLPTIACVLATLSCADSQAPRSLSTKTERADTRPLKCRHQRDPGLLVLVCDFRGEPDLYTEFLQGRLLPPEEAAMRATMSVRFGQRKPFRQSSFAPFSDVARDAAGWEIYDSKSRVAMLILGIQGYFGLALTRTDAASISEVKSLLPRIDFTHPEVMLGASE
jgi:hypothetical protein